MGFPVCLLLVCAQSLRVLPWHAVLRVLNSVSTFPPGLVGPLSSLLHQLKRARKNSFASCRKFESHSHFELYFWKINMLRQSLTDTIPIPLATHTYTHVMTGAVESRAGCKKHKKEKWVAGRIQLLCSWIDHCRHNCHQFHRSSTCGLMSLPGPDPP